jgi:hypothetical protein
LRWLLLLNLIVWTTTVVIVEISLRLLATTRYWVHTNQLLVGSGQTPAGKKWWPNTKYLVDSREFNLEFRTNAQGYRARPEPTVPGAACRIAFVGDSFTEGMQVAYESTFCARVERLLNQSSRACKIVCENYGVSSTDLFDYWHRIIHDILPANAPDLIALCIYPGNDFQCILPDDGFDAQDRPFREYFHWPGSMKHVIAWINLHSKLGASCQRAIFSIGSRREPWLDQGPRNWWTDPEVAARAASAPALRRARGLFAAIEEECRRSGTRLCILVVGPVANYKAVARASPLAEILSSWKLSVPVLDVAIEARARPDWYSLVFPVDGHLNEAGHAYIAEKAAPFLQVLAEAHRETRGAN